MIMASLETLYCFAWEKRTPEEEGVVFALHHIDAITGSSKCRIGNSR